MSGHAAPAPAEAGATENASKPSMMPKLIMGGFISMVVIAETMIFFLMVPNGDEVAALAESRLIKKIEATMNKDGEELAHEDENDVVEEMLGEFGIDSFVPSGTDRTYTVEFRLFGTIKRKDQSHFTQIFKDREGRFRHHLTLEIRNATIDELTENQLALIQRRILATSNEVLEEPILLAVGFHDYHVVEQ